MSKITKKRISLYFFHLIYVKKSQKIYKQQLAFHDSYLLRLEVSASSQPEPRSMKWESSGELAQRDLSELVTRLLDVESSNNSDELTRLSSKYDGES